MKKIIILGLAFFLNTINAQVNLDFNTAQFPESWTREGVFEISNAEIHPICQENSLIGTFFTPQTNSWIQTESYAYTGGNIQIHMTYGIKDLYHALGVNSTFQKPRLFLEFAEGNSENWIEHDEIPLENIEASVSCVNYNTIIESSSLSDFETVKYRFVYKSPVQTSTLYLLYWSIDKLQISREVLPNPCTSNLGGGLDPSFITVRINNTALDHSTYEAPSEYYHSYPREGNTTASLVLGQSYEIFTFTSSEAITGIWIDYNQNNDFEESEFMVLANNANSQNTTPITIPSTALIGNTKMRIRSRAYGSTILPNNACSNFGSGETRDYLLTIENSLGIETVVLKTKIKIYPNPSTGIVNIATPFDIKKVNVYNLIGQLLLSTTSAKIDISKLPSGTFLLETVLENGKSDFSRIIKP